jgi:hypothetical protein
MDEAHVGRYADGLCLPPRELMISTLMNIWEAFFFVTAVRDNGGGSACGRCCTSPSGVDTFEV